MAEAKKTEYVDVAMTDGRTVKFAGKRKLNKETIVDESKITLDGDSLLIQPGAVSVRMDFRNGDTRLLALPLSLIARFAGHGGEQKFGDNLATSADKPMSEDDMVLATDDLFADISKGEWGKGRAEGGGGVSGASVVVQALCEKFGKPVEAIKAYIEKRLAESKAKDGDAALTRRALYDAYRALPELAPIIKRLEDEKAAKQAQKAGIDVSSDLEAMAQA